MADFIAFNEGRTQLANNGLPATCYFLLSTKSIDATNAFVQSATLAGGVGEITGTGYTRKTEAEPTAVAGVVSFAVKTWTTGVATNWPATVRSVVLVTSSDNTGKALCAWNLQVGGAPRDLSGSSTTENVTPTLTIG